MMIRFACYITLLSLMFAMWGSVRPELLPKHSATSHECPSEGDSQAPGDACEGETELEELFLPPLHASRSPLILDHPNNYHAPLLFSEVHHELLLPPPEAIA